ncbi:MAG: response regulator [Candidatus Omnitrophica bacterium]|nr:response regulator [Candidatus Omnitrophota bacterium]
MPSQRILVVEDEPDVCAVLHSFLGRRGYEVSTTASGAEALKLISVIRPDLVLLDVTLYEMNGIEALKELRKRDQSTKVLLITGQLLEDAQVAEVLSLGALAILRKPISLLRLEELIVAAVGKVPFAAPACTGQNSLAKDADGRNLHKISNLLAVIRNSCEAFVLDEEEGFHKAGAASEIRAESTRVMRGIIDNVDRITERLAGVNSGAHKNMEDQNGK